MKKFIILLICLSVSINCICQSVVYAPSFIGSSLVGSSYFGISYVDNDTKSRWHVIFRSDSTVSIRINDSVSFLIKLNEKYPIYYTNYIDTFYGKSFFK